MSSTQRMHFLLNAMEQKLRKRADEDCAADTPERKMFERLLTHINRVQIAWRVVGHARFGKQTAELGKKLALALQCQGETTDLRLDGDNLDDRTEECSTIADCFCELAGNLDEPFPDSIL